MVEKVDFKSIRQELERRRKILVDRAHDSAFPMDEVERKHIIEYLEENDLPQRPSSEEQLLKEFVSSALSINQPPFRIRSRLKKVLGEIVLGHSVDRCLSLLFVAQGFRGEANWTPSALWSFVETLKSSEWDDFRMHVLRTLASIAVVMQEALAGGLEVFYARIEEEVRKGPEKTWAFMQGFTEDIWGLGPVLMSDFLKNVGFSKFVKIDIHLKREFPELVAVGKTDSRSMFIHAWRLCDQLNMTPFVFDHLLYQWGRLNNPSSLKTQRPCR